MAFQDPDFDPGPRGQDMKKDAREPHTLDQHLDDTEKAIAVLMEEVGLLNDKLEYILEPHQDGTIHAESITVARLDSQPERPKSEALRRSEDQRRRLEGIASRVKGITHRLQL